MKETQSLQSKHVPQPVDIIETAKLVATCTAAATAALLTSADGVR